ELEAERGARLQGERIERHRAAHLLQRLAVAPHDAQPARTPVMRGGVAGGQRYGAIERLSGSGPVPLVEEPGEAERGIRLAEARIERERALRGGGRELPGAIRGHQVVGAGQEI